MFISNAYAQSAASGFSMDSIGGYLPLVLMFVVLYFLMIRPQQKRQKEQRDMVEALAEGDEIVTSGGLLGTVTKVSENHVSMQMASGAEVFVQKAAVVALLPKGTLESL
ncbi:preprotein translocase subunit YajC [Oxalobacter sp. OttesenSCG-928-P03]|nr:preprotein translocase subunit YajC [Oxalobacter sp. OttesenSCG-928-P03]